MTPDVHRSLNDEVLDEMTAILIAAQNITQRVEHAGDVEWADRETLLRMTSRISAQADAILAWLMETPLESTRH
jgi:hypothetical protein